MSQEFESSFEEIGCTRSGKIYKVGFRPSFFEDSLDNTREQSQKHTKRAEGGIPYYPYTPQKPSGAQSNSAGTPSSSSHIVHTTFIPPTSTPPSGSNTATQNPPRRNRMGDDMKLPTFRGTRGEDLEQHWFLCEVVWTIKQINDDNVKLVQLATTLRERALTWYMKYTSAQNRTPVEVRTAMIKEFKKPKSKSQCITELKDIK